MKSHFPEVGTDLYERGEYACHLARVFQAKGQYFLALKVSFSVDRTQRNIEI